MWRIRLPQELLMSEAGARDLHGEMEGDVDAEIVAAFPSKLRETVTAQPEASPHAAAKGLLAALGGASLQELVPRLGLDSGPATALDGLVRAARLWQRVHRPEQLTRPVLLEVHESGDDACALIQMFSASTPEKAELEAVYFQRDESGWRTNPGFSGNAALALVKEGDDFKTWADRQRPLREGDWSQGLTVRLGGIAADSAPAEDEARRVVEAWREAIVGQDPATMLGQSACFDDAAGLSRMLRNSGYEMLGRQKGDILGVHRIGRWAAVSMRIPPAPGDDSADAYPLYVVAATPGGARVLPELDLFDPLTRGREFLNRKVWERLADRLPDGASGALESIFEKHRSLSAADRGQRPKQAE